ncbi:glycosyltransferase family 4 protein [Roseococcus sp. MDT2-1-1]|uniref:Glycosyltransferase family 4 protein n=1 Tax=Sabulicella glaciei TaxID=2984948 RepID=A0ABT3NZA6_9PROT|nr:glycosyltransferase family 4 protein [Roseococcus sp. MDT2-1-1]
MASVASAEEKQDTKADELAEAEAAEAAAEPPKKFDLLLSTVRAELESMEEPPPQLVPDDWFEYKVKGQFIELAAPASLSIEASFMQAIPTGTRHILLVPWLGVSGGSERITQLLIKALHETYGHRGVCVVAPDLQYNLDKSDRTQHAVPVAAINDVAPDCDLDGRIEILDRMMKEVIPDTVHNLNSDTGWFMFMERGPWHAQNAALFGNIYSDILYGDRFRLGAFWQYLPRCVEFMQGIIADNGAVVRSAVDTFSLPSSLQKKFFLLRTPVLGLPGAGGGFVNHPYRANAKRGTLWMSRVAREKRIDILAQVAARMPDHPFAMYGAIFAAAAKPDLDWLPSTPNVDFRGRYGAIFDLPLQEFSSYMFTSAAEGMPIALLEAAMLGLPLIAPRIGGIPELVDHETGWLVAGPDDVDGYVNAIEEADRDRGEAARRVAAAQARLSAEYSWEAFHRTLAQVPNYLSAELRS